MLALSQIGRADVAYRLLHQETYPSWTFSILNGATTIWERWNSWTPEQGFGDAMMNSFNHFSLGAVYQWMVETIGGIRSAAPAYADLVIAPTPGGRLTSAKASYASVRGLIETDWTLAADGMHLTVRLPANTAATIVSSGNSGDLCDGVWRPVGQSWGSVGHRLHGTGSRNTRRFWTLHLRYRAADRPPSMSTFLAFDIGAESGRAVLGTLEGGMLRAREIHRFPNAPVHIGTTWRWDVEALWSEIRRGADRVSERLDGIGVDTWGCDYVLLDRDGALVEASYCYRDSRTDGVMERVFERVPASQIYEVTGIQHLPFNTLYQLAAAMEHTPDIITRADRLLTIPDYFHYRMTGRCISEYTNATTTQCIDARTSTWAAALVESVGIPSRLFGEIAQPGDVLGALGAGVSSAHQGTPVVAPACHDTGSAVASIDASGDTAFLSSGTWSLLGTEVPAPVITPESSAWNFTNEGGVQGTIRLLKNIAGLWLLQGCRQKWAASGQSFSYDELMRGAEAYPSAFRTLLDPDHPGFLHPEDMTAAIADYCHRTGQDAPGSPSAYARAILESLALKYRFVLERLERLTGTSLATIRVIGGGAQNRLLNQFTADATGRTVIAGPTEATALGNLAMQMVGTGIVSTLAEARRIIEYSFPTERFFPADAESWETPYTRFCEYLELTCA